MMPWYDVQFWLVTAAMVVSLWVLVRPFLKRRDASGPSCGSCAAGAAACARPEDDGEPSKLVVLGRE